VVRSGLGSADVVHEQVVDALRADHPDLDADAVASRWIAESVAGWCGDAAGWPETTDYDRLQQAFGALEDAGIAVLQGCPDHWSARDALTAQERSLRGIAWFTAPDVWHAVGHGMLEVNLWHGSTANAVPGDALLEDVIAAFTQAGLEAHFDEGRVEVSAYWQRRPER